MTCLGAAHVGPPPTELEPNHHMTQTPATYREAWVKALLLERAQCEAAGKTERVAAIDQELRVFAADAQPPARRATRRVKKGDSIG